MSIFTMPTTVMKTIERVQNEFVWEGIEDANKVDASKVIIINPQE